MDRSATAAPFRWALALSSLVLAAACGGGSGSATAPQDTDGGERSPSPPPATTPAASPTPVNGDRSPRSTPATPDPSPSPTAGETRGDRARAPEEIFAVVDGARLLVLDRRGERVRTLYEAPAEERIWGDLDHDPSRDAVLVSTRADRCSWTLRRIEIATGRVVDEGPGAFPSVSPSGDLLAYARPAADGDDRCLRHELVVRDEAGRERTWLPDGDLVQVQGIAWSSDDELIVSVSSGEISRLYRVGVALSDGGAGPVEELGPDEPSSSWSDPAYLVGADSVLAYDACCHPGFDQYTRVIRIDPANGEPLGEAFAVDAAVETIDADASREHAVLVLRTGELLTYVDGELTEVTGGIDAAAW